MLKPSLATLRHAIDASVEALSQHVNAVNTEKLDTQEALNNLNEAIRAKQDDLSIMEDKLRGLNDQYRTSQEVRSRFRWKSGAKAMMETVSMRRRTGAKVKRLAVSLECEMDNVKQKKGGGPIERGSRADVRKSCV